ncbi:hypothetical protein F511_24602 [Dorcoceras hygrometricum]|uniref:Uncharacterized protein n=1 Tax=Dorcoceras hygrometricum TaxID=472368 RepID=A0A2Z7CCI5_9LAMI|nr:hypothetical protein F511_24602 [Dorcoceras hygrometricum]
MMVEISARLKVNWGHILFQTLVSMIWEINWVTNFLPKIDPADKGKGVLPLFDRPNPVEEHYLLIVQDIRDKVEPQIHLFDQWCRFRPSYRLNKITPMKLVEEFIKVEDLLLPWADKEKRLATSRHDPLGITDSACKNQLVVISVQYGPFNTYIPIRSATIGKSRVARDPIAMHTSWRSNSDIVSVTSIGYPRMRASGESSTTKHRLLHASGSQPIPPPNDPNIGYPRMRASGESSKTKHRLLHASGSHPIPPPNDPKTDRESASIVSVLGVLEAAGCRIGFVQGVV